MKRLSLVALVMLSGCVSPIQQVTDYGPADDGGPYTSDERIVRDARKQDQAVRRPGVFVDYGEVDKVVTVHVTDDAGMPVTNATMDVRFYFGRWRHASWSDIPASGDGDISLFAPGYFGPMRIEIWVVEAPGFKRRRLKNYSTHPADERWTVSVEQWKQMVALYSRGLRVGRHRLPEYRADRAVVRCTRQIVLRRK